MKKFAFIIITLATIKTATAVVFCIEPPSGPIPTEILSWRDLRGSAFQSSFSMGHDQHSNSWWASRGGYTVHGEARCSSTTGTSGQAGNPSTAVGTNCWCRITSPFTGPWAFNTNRTTNAAGDCPGLCNPACAYLCATNFINSGNMSDHPMRFRQAIIPAP